MTVDDQILARRQEDVVGAERSQRDGCRLKFVVDEIVGVDDDLRGVQRTAVVPHRNFAGRLKYELAIDVGAAILNLDRTGGNQRAVAVERVGRCHQAHAADCRVAVPDNELVSAGGKRQAIAQAAGSARCDCRPDNVARIQRGPLKGKVEAVGDRYANCARTGIAAISVGRSWGEAAVSARCGCIEADCANGNHRPAHQ